MKHIGRRKINVKQSILSAVVTGYEHKHDKYVVSVSVIPDATGRFLAICEISHSDPAL